jgi:hypothetical protein
MTSSKLTFIYQNTWLQPKDKHKIHGLRPSHDKKLWLQSLHFQRKTLQLILKTAFYVAINGSTGMSILTSKRHFVFCSSRYYWERKIRRRREDQNKWPYENEEKLRLIVENIAEAVIVANADRSSSCKL